MSSSSNLNINASYEMAEEEGYEQESLMIPSFLLRDSELYTPPETFEEKVFRQMEININDSLQENIYARMRIEEHLKDIKKLRDKFGNVFKD